MLPSDGETGKITKFVPKRRRSAVAPPAPSPPLLQPPEEDDLVLPSDSETGKITKFVPKRRRGAEAPPAEAGASAPAPPPPARPVPNSSTENRRKGRKGNRIAIAEPNCRALAAKTGNRDRARGSDAPANRNPRERGSGPNLPTALQGMASRTPDGAPMRWDFNLAKACSKARLAANVAEAAMYA